jgi:hypothetical protein
MVNVDQTFMAFDNFNAGNFSAIAARRRVIVIVHQSQEVLPKKV